MTLRAAIYLRLSVAQDADISHSVEYQQIRCEALCTQAGYEIEATYVDDGFSAFVKNSNRPGWTMLREAVNAKEFDVLVFDRQDRLARQQKETLRFIADCDDAGILWHSAKEGVTDLSDPMQVMFAVYRGGDAQAYSATISRNMTVANSASRAKGEMFRSGVVPFGFNEDRQTLCGPEADLIRSGIHMILDGRSLGDVVRMFRDSPIQPKPRRVRKGEDKTVSPWQRIAVRDMLVPWRNAAVQTYKGEPTDEPGNWEALVTKDELEQVRTILLSPVGERKTALTLASGIARCHCNEVLRGRGGAKPVYACQAWATGNETGDRHVSIRRPVLDERIRSAVVGYFLVNKDEGSRPDAETQKLASLYAEREGLKQERARVQDGWKRSFYTTAEAEAEFAVIDAKRKKTEAIVEQMVTESASLRLRAEMLKSIDVRNQEAQETKTLAEANQDLTERVAQAFDALTLDQARDLVRSIMTIKVTNGRGDSRIDIKLLKRPTTAVAQS